MLVSDLPSVFLGLNLLFFACLFSDLVGLFRKVYLPCSVKPLMMSLRSCSFGMSPGMTTVLAVLSLFISFLNLSFGVCVSIGITQIC